MKLLKKIALYILSLMIILSIVEDLLSEYPMILVVIMLIIVVVCAISVILNIYKNIYFNSDRFAILVQREKARVSDINDLNLHVAELNKELSDLGLSAPQYGQATTSDNSIYQYKRSAWKSFSNNNNVYHCSLQICRNAQNDPMRYLCKYFNVPFTTNTMSKLDEMINTYSTLTDGIEKLSIKKKEAIKQLDIPWIIRSFFIKEFEERIGYQPISVSQIVFPEYIFQYISAGGNSSATCKIRLDIANLEELEKYISDRIKYINSAIGQRRLMTRALREKIKKRDNYTCRYCGISVMDEPHLLLEIDHIKPLSKGGMTEENNLQTLCWRCNRRKGASY